MESCLKAALTASCLAFVVTVVVLVIGKGIKLIPSVVMVLVGNYLCIFVFSWVFDPLFSGIVESQWVASSGVPDPKIIRFELIKFSASNTYIGLFAGLLVSMALAAVLANKRKVES